MRRWLIVALTLLIGVLVAYGADPDLMPTQQWSEQIQQNLPGRNNSGSYVRLGLYSNAAVASTANQANGVFHTRFLGQLVEPEPAWQRSVPAPMDSRGPVEALAGSVGSFSDNEGSSRKYDRFAHGGSPGNLREHFFASGTKGEAVGLKRTERCRIPDVCGHNPSG